MAQTTPGLTTAVSGDIWWGGFTAEITITNSSGADLSEWSYVFDSPHQLNSAPWGATLHAEPLDNGLTRYTLSGSSWGANIPAGGSMTVGFNGLQGVDLGVDGALSQDLLMVDATPTSVGVQAPDPEPTPAPVVESEPVAAEPEPIEVIEAVESAPVVDVPDPVIEEPVMDHGSMDHAEMDHSGMEHGMAHDSSSGEYTDITSWGTFHGSNHNSEHDELVGGRTAITTEAMVAYNGLRAFAGLDAVEIEVVGEWAFSQGLTNNSQAWGDDTKGVGLWYAMQGAKVGWIADEAYDPQILADIQRTARLGSENDVMGMVREFGHEGFADYIQQSGLQEALINTLKMEPHYGGWMHGRTHGFLDVEGVAIAHDINHLTVLGWDQSQPFMNDTFDWPQWPALDVSDQTVINYYQGIVALGDPLSQNLEDLAGGGAVNPEPQPVPFPGPLLPDESPVEVDSIVGSPVDVEVGGDLWWGGFTASLTVTNQSDQALDDWALSFPSAHRFYGEAWGVEVVTEQLAGDLYRYELTGADWGQSIGAGESRTVGFNAMAGTEIGRNGTLSEDALLAAGTDFTVL
jgi:hypothetical protein